MACQLTFQFGLSEPISTLVRNSITDPLVEDNGWPNIEGRLAFGVGETQEFMEGGESNDGSSSVFLALWVKFELQSSAPNELFDDVLGLGCDLEWAVTDRLGMKGELFIGQTL